jgi:signal transduction histidine kinase/ActR/RegA family two-component response regulator
VKVNGRPVDALRRRLLRRAVPYGLFTLACGLSLAASWYLSSTAASTAESQARAEFLADAQQISRQIQSGLSTYMEVVRAGAVLLSADNEINGLEFRRFVDGLELPQRYPGMEGIGFVQCVRQQNLRRFLRIMDLDGNMINVWPQSTRDEHCPTVFLEPNDRNTRNQEAIGFDLSSEPALDQAMAVARDTGQPAVSRKLMDPAVWDKGWRGNVVLLIPVYRFAAPVRTVVARRRALIGFVFSPFNSVRLLQDLVTSTIPPVALHVYDGPTPTPDNLLGWPSTPVPPGWYEFSEVVQVAGREWLIAVKSVGEPTGTVPQAARQTLVGGFILSLMLFLITRAQVRAWETAARHAAELRSSADALRESESQAQAANHAKDEFLATLSHELRTPSNVVLGWISMLRHGAVRGERLDHALEIIDRNARHQADLIDDLLDVSRIATGKLRLELRQLALAPIVAAVVESLRPGAEAKGVAMIAPAADDAFNILGDPDRLHQIVWNLIANAIKFTPPGGEVWVELRHQARHATLTVRDTGIGIAPEFLPHAFERFSQADSSTTRTHSGVGLGLAIVRHLVALHGGTIHARSEGAGLGATFIVELPAVAASAASTSVIATLPLTGFAPSSGPRLDGVRVLVVDDDPSTLELLTEALGTTGAQVTTSGSARDALERLRKTGIDVIVSDIAMPGEDGFWLMEHLRAVPGTVGRTPAIALSALARSEDRTRAIEAGFQMHLAKPVQLGELQARVAALSARRSDAAG